MKIKELTNQDFHHELFQDFKEEYGFSFLDFYFSQFLMEKEDDKSFISAFFLMYLSMETRKGNICIDLNSDPKLFKFVKNYNISIDQFKNEIIACEAVGKDSSKSPIVYENDFFYLNRYYNYENFFSKFIISRALNKNYDKKTISKLNQIIPKYFKDSKLNPDWQMFAALTACFSQFCAVSGGPGTGKTTVIVKIIAVIFELWYPKIPEIILCAPTGKAASRLVEAINNTISSINLNEEIKKNFPSKASTIHRLLGFSSKTNRFVFNKNNRLKADVVIVDEASMIDMKLMANLCEALEDHSKLILLGDRFQLASVSPGSVFGDICKRGEKTGCSNKYIEVLKNFFDEKGLSQIPCSDDGKISDSIVELKKSYRFDKKSGIGKLAEAVKNMDTQKCFDIFDSGFNDIEFIETKNYSDFKTRILGFADKYYKRLGLVKDPELAFKYFSEFMILSPLNDNEYGVSGLNLIIENLFTNKKSLEEKLWYNGKPVIITKNDYINNLFNGDTGICLEDRNGENKVFFQSSDLAYKTFHPLRLNNCQSVFSMTIHKSQGSEFDNVLIVLPEYETSVLSRELIYTAVTRARKKVYFLGKKSIFQTSIKRSVSRSSGLYSRLWKK
ncbi:MAG: exodeoxyribonuclease V subunit alpha [Desulforegulaceae bacterium]|nr:exodeoxyribonuclease V subunit alpha [Desulforegulaceae bacterium]